MPLSQLLQDIIRPLKMALWVVRMSCSVSAAKSGQFFARYCEHESVSKSVSMDENTFVWTVDSLSGFSTFLVCPSCYVLLCHNCTFYSRYITSCQWVTLTLSLFKQPKKHPPPDLAAKEDPYILTTPPTSWAQSKLLAPKSIVIVCPNNGKNSQSQVHLCQSQQFACLSMCTYCHWDGASQVCCGQTSSASQL